MRKQFVFVLHGKEYLGKVEDAAIIESGLDEVIKTFFSTGVTVNHLKLELMDGNNLVVIGASLPYFSFYTKTVV